MPDRLAEIIPLQCPCCKEALNDQGTSLGCQRCGAAYPVYDGIPSFRETDAFYEGKFTETEPDSTQTKKRLARIALDFYRAFSQSHLRNRFIAKMMKSIRRPRVILDLGCGGGSYFLSRMGYVVGIDLSLASLRNAKKVYNQAVHSDISAIPFPDACFDFIVSRDVLGHIPPTQKESVYQEMFRLCRNGGRVIHAIEVDSWNPVWRFAQKYPSLFRQYFLDQYGHYGLEAPEKACHRLEKVGFYPVKINPLFRTGIVRANQYIAMFDNEYRQRSKLINFIVVAAKVVDSRPLLRGAYSFLAGVLDTLLGIALPFSWAQLLLVCYEKDAAFHSSLKGLNYRRTIISRAV